MKESNQKSEKESQGPWKSSVKGGDKPEGERETGIYFKGGAGATEKEEGFDQSKRTCPKADR